MSNARSSNAAPRPARARAARPDKPAGVALNLDTLEREGPRGEPFVAIIEARPREFIDPYELDWQDLLVAMNDPRMMFRLALSDEDFDEVMDARIPTWKFNQLTEAYLRHYGIDAAALGNTTASRT